MYAHTHTHTDLSTVVRSVLMLSLSFLILTSIQVCLQKSQLLSLKDVREKLPERFSALAV